MGIRTRSLEGCDLLRLGRQGAAVTIGLGCLAGLALVYYGWPSDRVPVTPSAEQLREVLRQGPSESTLPKSGPAETSSSNRSARADAAARLGAMRDEQSMPLLLEAMEDPDPLVRGRSGVAVQKIMKADYYFRANDPPERRRQALAKIRIAWEGYVRHKQASGSADR